MLTDCCKGGSCFEGELRPKDLCGSIGRKIPKSMVQSLCMQQALSVRDGPGAEGRAADPSFHALHSLMQPAFT